jgi:hypothetical protein
MLECILCMSCVLMGYIGLLGCVCGVAQSFHEPPVCLPTGRHVDFDESSFPFASSDTPPDDLDSLFTSSHVVHSMAPLYSSVAGTLKTLVTVPRDTFELIIYTGAD